MQARGGVITRQVQGQGISMPGHGGPFDSPMFPEFFGGRGAVPRFPQPAPKQAGLGSGVILTDDGYVITNNHVVADADEIVVRLSDGEEHDAKVVATDPSTDVAVIKRSPVASPSDACDMAAERTDRPTLLRVTDGKTRGFLVVG